MRSYSTDQKLSYSPNHRQIAIYLKMGFSLRFKYYDSQKTQPHYLENARTAVLKALLKAASD